VALISTAANVDTLEKTNKVIRLTTNKKSARQHPINFSILSGADANKFTLSGAVLTFKATAFKDRDDAAYRVNIQAIQMDNRWSTPRVEGIAKKTLTVTVHNRILRITTADVSTV
jgi:hypothetical protein